jgi:hypothetical protein
MCGTTTDSISHEKVVINRAAHGPALEYINIASIGTFFYPYAPTDRKAFTCLVPVVLDYHAVRFNWGDEAVSLSDNEGSEFVRLYDVHVRLLSKWDFME